MVVSLVVAQSSPAQHGDPEDADPDFVSSCSDGQAAGDGSNGCDLDGKADGYCTFGSDEGRKFRIKVGATQKIANSCHAVGQFTCDPARAPAPKIIDLGKDGSPRRGNSLPTVVPQGHEPKNRQFTSCTRDSDCVATYKNGCTTHDKLKDWQDPGNPKVSCRCLKGPVSFGCVPYDRMGNRLNP